MPLRVGIDLVSVEQVRESLATHGESYLKRLYSERELEDCTGDSGVDAQRLAARFAAKEATLKVLRPAPEQAVPWQAIELRRDPAGWVELALSGSAAELAQAAGMRDLAVSIAHEQGFATALVVAEVGH
jgi:holo-[acyl-carrier protein] synthase